MSWFCVHFFNIAPAVKKSKNKPEEKKSQVEVSEKSISDNKKPSQEQLSLI